MDRYGYAISPGLGEGLIEDGEGEWVLHSDAEAQIAALRAEKDGAYLERNQVVAALAKCFPSGIARTAIDGWSDDWHGCVYIDLPTGQVSWHFHDSHAHLFAGLPHYAGSWDGHDTPEKYRRLAALATQAAEIERLREQLRLANIDWSNAIAAEESERSLRERRERQIGVIVGMELAASYKGEKEGYWIEWYDRRERFMGYDGSLAGLLAAIDEVAK